MPDDAAGRLGTLIFAEPLLLLASAVFFVALFKRLGLGSVLGYLAAGVLVGPVLGVISDAQAIFHVAELGVVLFLFIIGLELRPARLRAMRADIFGLGFAQVAVTGLVLTVGLRAAGWRMEPAIIIGFGLAMSSTAFGMQILQERNETTTAHGRKSVAILLFQDIAIVPLLAILPLLSPTNAGSALTAGGLFSGIAAAAGALAALYLAGRYLLNPMFRLLAHVKAKETMTAAALLIVLGAAALMHLGGMSMAMGAFAAGVILADSSFRHELEANIEPFRGVLLGLFFMAVGMSINIDALAHSWLAILVAVALVMTVKAAILYGLARVFRAGHNDAVRVAGLLPQAGEFAFVLFAAAASVRALWPSDTSFVAAVVTVTMALTPLSVWIAGRLVRQEAPEVLEEDFEGAGGDVLVIGFGRFGQIVSQVLLARGISVTIIDASAERIRQAARFGFRIYFGDGTRRDVSGRQGRTRQPSSAFASTIRRPRPQSWRWRSRSSRPRGSSRAPGTATTRWSSWKWASTWRSGRPSNRRWHSGPRRCAPSGSMPTRSRRPSPTSAAATPTGFRCSGGAQVRERTGAAASSRSRSYRRGMPHDSASRPVPLGGLGIAR